METKWTGSVKDLVNYVARTDARETVVDTKTGAKIRINIDGLEGAVEGKDEPFYIESPDGENLYDAYNRREAIAILSNIRKGIKYPDMAMASVPSPVKKKKAKGKKHSRKRSPPSTTLKSMRR